MNPSDKSARVNQYEVLEWVFFLGKYYDCYEGFQERIKKALVRVSDGEVIDFEAALKELVRGD